MPVTVTDPVAGPYTPNGVTTAFGFNFKIAAASEIAVFIDDVAVDPDDYSVSISVDAEGGTVTFYDAPTGAALYLHSNPSFTQTTSFNSDGPFSPRTLNNAFDRAAIRDLRLRRDLSNVSGTVDAAFAALAALAEGGIEAGTTVPVSSRSVLAVLDPASSSAFLEEEGRQGLFIYTATDLSDEVAADTLQGFYVAPYSDPTGASGAWVRSWDGTVSFPEWFGAKGDGVTNDAAAVESADALTGSISFAPGNYLLSSTPTITGVLDLYPGVTLSGAGAAGLGYASNGVKQTIYSAQSEDEFASQYIRRTNNRSDGTNGFVSSALRVDSYVGPNVTNYEWTGVFVLDNSATGGQNTSLYSKAIKRSGAGPTFSGAAEVINDYANPTSGVTAFEFDVSVNGTDNNNGRVGADLVIRKHNPAGADAVAAWGYRVQHGDYPTSLVKTAFGLGSGMQTEVCFDASPGLNEIAAFKMGINDAFVASEDNTKKFTHTGGAWSFQDATVEKVALLDSGGVSILGNQVVGARGASVANATDAASAITQLNLLLARLRVHGLIAT